MDNIGAVSAADISFDEGSMIKKKKSSWWNDLWHIVVSSIFKGSVDFWKIVIDVITVIYFRSKVYVGWIR